MTHAAAARVREFLLAAGFTADGVLTRVGAEALAALGRGVTVPVRRALAQPPADGPGPATQRLDRLVELFLLADPVPGDLLPAAVVDDLTALGLARRDGGLIRPQLEVRPYGEPDTDWFLVSDLGSPGAPDHVLGAGGASLTLARITPRRELGRALDLGCGCGIQALHAARHATRVVATDSNPRALSMSALSAALSGVPADQLDLREGSLFDPVADEWFDLIVSNPPFVISPAYQFAYRDAGLPGDELSRLVVRGAANHLAPGGVAVVLGNWLHVAGEDWRDRLAEWVSDLRVSAWIVERDSQSVAEYAATWLGDAGMTDGPEFDAAMGQWLDMFADERCEAVGFGWIVLSAPEPTAVPTAQPWIVVEDLSHSPRLPWGDEVRDFLAGCDLVDATSLPELLSADLRLSDGVIVTTAAHSADGRLDQLPPRLGRPSTVGPGGWRSDVAVPPGLLAALLADSDTPIGERLDAAAQAEGLEPLDVLGSALMGLRELMRIGIVRSAG